MAITTVKYELVPYNGRDPMFEAGCAICNKRTCFDIYNNENPPRLVETVCSEECFNLLLLRCTL